MRRHTQVNTDDLTLHLLFTTLCRVPSAERCTGDSGSRGASESSARELLRARLDQLQCRVEDEIAHC
jgi:hypothetical protein